MATIIDIILETVRTEGKTLGWSRAEMASFLGQIEHESASFTRTREYSWSPDRAYQIFTSRFKTLANARAIYARSGSAGLFEVMYTGKIGNNLPGDGAKYIGRGWIQITGKDNYALIERKTGLKVLDNPELLEDPKNATIASMVWWHENVHPRITNWSDVEPITRIVNGPARLGMTDRANKTIKWLKIV